MGQTLECKASDGRARLGSKMTLIVVIGALEQAKVSKRELTRLPSAIANQRQVGQVGGQVFPWKEDPMKGTWQRLRVFFLTVNEKSSQKFSDRSEKLFSHVNGTKTTKVQKRSFMTLGLVVSCLSLKIFVLVNEIGGKRARSSPHQVSRMESILDKGHYGPCSCRSRLPW